jgi:hypothetical protein
MPSNGIACYREIIRERKSQLILQTLLLSYLKKLPQPPRHSATTNIEARPSISKNITTRRKLRWLAFLARKYF